MKINMEIITDYSSRSINEDCKYKLIQASVFELKQENLISIVLKITHERSFGFQYF